MSRPEDLRIAILHYTAPPVTGGVEAVMQAHAGLLAGAGVQVSVVAGRGDASALPAGVDLTIIPEMDSSHPRVAGMRPALDAGEIPGGFEDLTRDLYEALRPVLANFQAVMVHNVLTKHFNLALTAALFRLLDEGALPGCTAWCHDLSWTSPNSRSKVYPRYPWDLLRSYRPEITYVAVSEARRDEMCALYQVPPQAVRVIYNGVDPREIFGLSDEGLELVQKIRLWDSELILLMPVRVTRAKNVEYALELLAEIHRQGIKASIVLTGPPDPHAAASQKYFDELVRLRDELGLQGWMHFVFQSGSDPNEPYLVRMDLVGELYRICDLVLMPSHREGFGLPVVEAALLGTPVAATPVPAAKEIGGEDIFLLDLEQPVDDTAAQLLAWLDGQPTVRFRRRARSQFLWQKILEMQILPLLMEQAK